MDKAQDKGAEKRKYKRLNKQFVVRVQTQGTSGEWDMVLIKNISKGGLLFNYHEELEEGMTLNLKINVGLNENPVHCTGKVVRVRTDENTKTCEAGVSFTEIRSADSDLIDQTVEKFLSEEKDK